MSGKTGRDNSQNANNQRSTISIEPRIRRTASSSTKTTVNTTNSDHSQVTISDRIRRVNAQYLAASKRAGNNSNNNHSASKVNARVSSSESGFKSSKNNPAANSELLKMTSSTNYNQNSSRVVSRSPRTLRSQPKSALYSSVAEDELFHNNTDMPETLTSKSNNKPKKKRGKIIRRVILGVFLVLILTVASLAYWANSTYNSLKDSVKREAVLSNAADDGNNADVFLIVGNDSRGANATSDVLGSRSDTIMLLIHTTNGSDSLVSLPRDTRVLIPSFIDTKGLFGTPNELIEGHYNKLNTAYSYGGAPLLIKTVENLTMLKIDHYVETGFEGLVGIVDAVGGINVCYDDVIDDWYSGLKWEGGCKDIDGQTALAFSRMRYQDPLGDVGRNLRQHQVINKVAMKLQDKITEASPTNLYNVHLFIKVADDMLDVTTFDESTTLWDMKDLCIYFKKASANIALDNSVIPIIEQSDWDPVLGSIVSVNLNDVRSFFINLVNN